MNRGFARLIAGLTFVFGIAASCLPARAALHASGVIGRRSMPASTSTTASTFNSLAQPQLIRALNTPDQTTFFGPPYYHHGYANNGPWPTIPVAIEMWWADYQRVWDMPNCTYQLTYYTPTVDNGGLVAGMAMENGCSGGNGIFATATNYDPRKNNGNPGGCCSAGDPINLATGNEYEEQNDYSVPGPLKFSRYYNSSAVTASTHIGANWRHSFDRSIEYLTDGTTFQVTVYRPDGKEVLFQKTNGTWTADPDIHDALLENDDAQGNVMGWSYFVADTQQIESYDANGLLTSIEDLNGQVTTLTYSNSTTPSSVAPAAGLLITVTDPRGRQLNFIYDSTSRITQIALPDGSALGYSYDASNNLSQVTYPGGATRAYVYNESGSIGASLPNALTGIVDENGKRYADIHYDSQGRATFSQLGKIGDLTQVSYNSDGTTTVTYPLGVQSIFNFASPYGMMRVSSIGQPCDPACSQNAASRTYDVNGNPASTTDFDGNATAYSYDSYGLETQRIDAQGSDSQRTINTSWDDALRNPLGREVLDAHGTLTLKSDWSYNDRGQVLARCDDDPTVSGATSYVCSNIGTPPAGVRRWTYTYCDTVDGTQCPLIGLLLSVDGPRTDVSDVTRYSYYLTTDESGCATVGSACHHAGDLATETDALGHVTQTVSYDKDGRPTETTDPNGVVTTLSYTARGWLHSRSVAGATTTIDYDAVGNVIKVTQPDGVFTSYTYDDAHRLISIIDALGNHIDYTLDAAGNRTAENTYAMGSSTPSRSLSRQYNTLGQLVKDLDAYSHATTYSYDANGNRTNVTDSLGVTTHLSYDASNRLLQVIRNYQGVDTNTANTTTSYTYNSHDQLIGVSDPDSLNTDYIYDDLNDLDQQQSPDSGTSNYAYDAVGNRLSQTDARGVVSTYSYDALNRLTAIAYPLSKLNVHYYYDEPNTTTGCASSYPIGRMTRMANVSGTTTYCYDSHGNVISKKVGIAGQTGATTYSYNSADRLMGITYPSSGVSITYTRDAAGRIASVSTSSTPIVSSISYLPFGPATQYTFASGGQVLTKTYDANYRATDVVGGAALNLHFALDPVGDITAEGDAAGVPTANETYQYDPLYRLQQVDDATGALWQSYTYDKTGDRLSKTTAGQTAADIYSYTPNTHHLIGISGYDASNRAMDANGNTTALQANGYMYGLGYDNTDRLNLVQQNGTTVANYALNGKGERGAKTFADGSAQVYFYDEGGRLLEETYVPPASSDPGLPGVPTCGGGWGQAHCLGIIAGGQTSPPQFRNEVWADSTLVATLDGSSTVHYVYTDHLGTPRAITNTTSSTPIWTWPWLQNPFGEKPASGAAGYTFNLRYPGQYFDAETGLNYNYFRDYEPATGRYVQSDPVGLAGGISTYNYVDARSLALVDPTGRWCVPMMDETTDWVTTRRERGLDPELVAEPGLVLTSCTWVNAWELTQERNRRSRSLCFECKTIYGPCGAKNESCGFKIEYGNWHKDTPRYVFENAKTTGFQFSTRNLSRCTVCRSPFAGGRDQTVCEDGVYGDDKAIE